ncbi:MAG: glycosyltransferase involved in cell wall biosynthesis [Bermanella sp.]|jgi:glycosyltransferase involved in cell wall biosynthesis
MTKVLFCASSSKSPIGDGFVELVEELSSQGENFNKEFVVVVGPGLRYEFDHLPHLRVFFLNMSNDRKSSYLNIYYWLRYSRFLARCNATSLFIYSNSPICFLARFFFFACRILIIWDHDPVLHPCESFLNKLIKNLDKILIRSFYRPRFIVASSYLKSLTETVWFGPIFKNRVDVVPFPAISALSGEIKTFGSNRPIDILFFGRVEPYKGVENLIAALQILDMNGSTFRVEVIGRGADKHRNAKFRNLSVNFTDDYVSDEFLSKKIISSRVCVFPYTSGTGTQTVPTALANGCHVVCSDIPSFSEYLAFHPVVRVAKHDVPSDLAEQLELSLSDFGVGPSIDVSDFSVDRFARNISEILNEVD